MNEQNEFFFELIQNSTQLYRETYKSEDFYIQSFFEEPQSSNLFIQLEPYQEEDILFSLERKSSIRFPAQIQQKFFRLLSQSPNKEEDQRSSKKNFNLSIKNKNKKKSQKIKKGNKGGKKVLAQSEITKNACFNIVQKTISLIRSEEYGEKLQEICKKFGEEKQEFKTFIFGERTRFTGTKALEMFLEEKEPKRLLFASFLKWFLQQKYIRHALKSGQMSDLKAYIKFKNEVMLPLL